jgi:SAM-dependent methyltransferase
MENSTNKDRTQSYHYADGQSFLGQSTVEIFTHIYENNFWEGGESVSGIGSSLAQTAGFRNLLPHVFQSLGIRSLLDIPCGDFHWMQHVDLGGIPYFGADIVRALIEHNQAQYGNEERQFQCLNLLEDQLPTVDLIFCRDCLVHFSFQDIFQAIANLKRSGSTFLMTTTFASKVNQDEPTGGWRPLNFQLPPFNFPEPILTLLEHCTEQDGAFEDKALSIWKIDQLLS